MRAFVGCSFLCTIVFLILAVTAGPGLTPTDLELIKVLDDPQPSELSKEIKNE